VTTILVVEDDAPIARSLRTLLEGEGYAVRLAETLAEARRALQDAPPDAMLLDWRLPDGEGIDLLKEVRKTSELPILLVTARADVIDKVLGLEIGADDYVTKPLEPRELLARLKARLRTRGARPNTTSVLEHDGVRIDHESREATCDGNPVALGRVEFDLLAVLVANPGRVFSRQELLHRVWGYERPPATRTVDMHVAFLRTKLGAERIQSVRGVGYRMRKNFDERLTDDEASKSESLRRGRT
jgi:DNA-binding response OmpR family regulator